METATGVRKIFSKMSMDFGVTNKDCGTELPDCCAQTSWPLIWSLGQVEL